MVSYDDWKSTDPRDTDPDLEDRRDFADEYAKAISDEPDQARERAFAVSTLRDARRSLELAYEAMACAESPIRGLLRPAIATVMLLADMLEREG